jgi:hypothetical protein
MAYSQEIVVSIFGLEFRGIVNRERDNVAGCNRFMIRVQDQRPEADILCDVRDDMECENH